MASAPTPSPTRLDFGMLAEVGMTFTGELPDGYAFSAWEGNESADAAVYEAPDGSSIAFVRRLAQLPDGGESRLIDLDGRQVQVIVYPGRADQNPLGEIRVSEEVGYGLLLEVVGKGEPTEQQVIDIMRSVSYDPRIDEQFDGFIGGPAVAVTFEEVQAGVEIPIRDPLGLIESATLFFVDDASRLGSATDEFLSTDLAVVSDTFGYDRAIVASDLFCGLAPVVSVSEFPRRELLSVNVVQYPIGECEAAEVFVGIGLDLTPDVEAYTVEAAYNPHRTYGP